MRHMHGKILQLYYLLQVFAHPCELVLPLTKVQGRLQCNELEVVQQALDRLHLASISIDDAWMLLVPLLQWVLLISRFCLRRGHNPEYNSGHVDGSRCTFRYQVQDSWKGKDLESVQSRHWS